MPGMLEVVNWLTSLTFANKFGDLTGLVQDSLPFVGPAKAAVLAGLVAERAPALAVEVGALAGYSALTIAQALPPGGRLVSIESDWKWALVAKRFVWQAAQGEKRSKAVRLSQHTLGQQCVHSACPSFPTCHL